MRAQSTGSGNNISHEGSDLLFTDTICILKEKMPRSLEFLLVKALQELWTKKKIPYFLC